MTKKRNYVRLYFLLALIGLLVMYVWPSTVAAISLTTKHQFDRVWRLARDIGRYDFSASVTQTIYPTAHIDNIGRSPEITRMTTSGSVDRPNRAMALSLWTQDGPRDGIEIRIEDGQAFGRTAADDEWTKLDNPTTAFAPGNDLMAFALAAENVQQVTESEEGETDPLTAARVSQASAHYTFDINGPRFAQYMRNQMQAELARTGELPPSLQLDVVDQYVHMEGRGELWVNQDGLPIYQIVYISLPPERGALDRVEAEIATTFSNWDGGIAQNQLFWAIPRLVNNPSTLIEDPLSFLPTTRLQNPETLQQAGVFLGLMLLVGALAIFVFTHRDSRKVYAALALSTIVMMVATPLLQANRVQAFSARQQTKQAEQQHQQNVQESVEDLAAEMSSRDFNPAVNPLAGGSLPPNLPAVVPKGGGIFASPPLERTEGELFIPRLQTTCVITDAAADCDGDGLSNGAELFKLGTDPEDIDSDGDRISDGAEAAGFSNGQQWYLDPLNFDSNGDTQIDWAECPQLVDVGEDGALITPSGTACADTDNDNTPDVFDFDNDGDGVPDSVDVSPNYVGALNTTLQDEINVDLSGYNTGETVLVEFQLRPANPEHLWQTRNVLDWPDNDMKGQVARVKDNTFASRQGGNTQTPNLRNGDMMLSPMLEIRMPAPADNSTNPSSNLPISSTFDGDVTSATLSEWLDTTMLDEYGIFVSQDEDDGTLIAYVPLVLIQDPVGDTPVTWGAQMVYRPEIANWGAAHEARLVWSITALTDYCDTSNIPDEITAVIDGETVKIKDDGDRYDYWCSDDRHWRTNAEPSIIHSYTEQFTLTGLSITEDNGAKSAVIAQTDALSVNYESYLWHLANGLSQTYMQGDLVSDGTRFDIAEIADRFDKDSANYTTGDAELWGIPHDKLDVLYNDQAADQTTGLKSLVETQIPSLLNNTYGSSQPDAKVLALVVREEASRSTQLGNTGTVAVTGNSISANLASLEQEVYGAVNWAPYENNGSKWLSYDVYDYLDDLQTGLTAELANLDAEDIDLLTEGETVRDLELVKLGVIGLAKSFYVSLNQGLGDIVEISGTAVGEDIIDDAALSLNGQSAVLLISDDMLELFQTIFETERSIVVGDQLVASSVDSLTQKIVILETMGLSEKQLFNPLTRSISDSAASAVTWASKKIFKKIFKLKKTTPKYGKFAKKGATIIGMAAVGIAVLGPKYGLSQREAYTTAASLNVAAEGLKLYGAYSKLKLYQAAQLFKTEKMITLGKNIKKVTKSGAIIGLVVDIGFIVGFLTYTAVTQNLSWGSLALNSLIAQSIGELVVAIILAVISATVIGAIIVAVIGVIDAIIYLVCKALDVEADSDVDKWVCGGITGAVAKGITTLIYDQYVTVDLDKKDRLDMVMNSPTVLGDAGLIPNAGFKISMEVTNTLSLADPDGLIVRTSYIDANGNLDRNRLREIMRRSNFDYFLQEDEIGRHANLGLDQLSWPNDAEVFSSSLTISFAEAGLNQEPSVYLTEAFNVAAIECWGFIGADEDATCEEKPFQDSLHTYLGESFILDIFPTTLDEFLALENVGNDSYRLTWGDSSGLPFPTQADADGDGLRSKAVHGNDPNDSTPDTDGDGLSDYWERNNDTNPTDADTDGDGLTDYWEIFYRTNPWRADTDGDGLRDGQEFYHSSAPHPYTDDNGNWTGGWTIVYDYDASGNRLQTLVSADPTEADLDGDTILDGAEFIYGYNPNLVSALNVMSLDAEIETDSAQAGIVGAGGTVVYTATVVNKLDNRIAEGLLQVELPTDEVVATQVMDTIFPQESVTLNDSVAAPSVGATTVTSMTVRAGAIIAEESDRVLWLNFNEADGATLFQDNANSPLGPHNGTCSGDACPRTPDDGSPGYKLFENNDIVTVPHSEEFNLNQFTIHVSFSNVADEITVDSIVDTAFSKGDAIQMGIDLQGAGQIGTAAVTVYDGACTTPTTLFGNRPGGWMDLMVTYNGTQLKLYEDGYLARTAALSSICTNEDDIVIGSDNFGGYIGEVEIFNRVLTADEIAVAAPWIYMGSYEEVNSTYTQPLDPTSEFVKGYYECNYDPYTEGGNTLASYSCPTAIDGPAGSAMSFNRGSKHNEGLVIDPINPTPLGGVDGSFTISMWLNPRSHYQPDNAHIQTYGQQVFGSFRHTLNKAQPSLFLVENANNGKQYVMMRFGHADGNGYCEATSSRALTLNEWQFVTVTFDGSQFKLYVGDKLKDTFTDLSCNGETPYQSNEDYSLGKANATAVQLKRVNLTNYEIFGDDVDETIKPIYQEGYRPQVQINQYKLYNSENNRLDGTTVVESGDLWEIDLPYDSEGILLGPLALYDTWMTAPYDDDLSDSQIKPGYNSVYFEICHKISENADPDYKQQLECSVDNRWYATAGDLANLIWFEADPTNTNQFIQHTFSVQYDEVYQSHTGDHPITISMAGQIDYKPYNNAFKGNVDELRVFNTALTADAVALLLESSTRGVELPFDEPPGQALFVDATGNGNTASCIGDACPDSGIPGRSNQALRFDAGIDDANSNDSTGDFVTLGSSDALGLTNNGSFTAMAWVKPDTVNSTQAILGLNSTDPFYLRLVNGQLNASVGASNEVTVTNTSLAANTWAHVAWVYNADAGEQRLYVNGSRQITGTVTTPYATDSALLLGMINDGSFFDGLIDEVVVERYALHPAQIRDAVDEAPLLNLHFDEDVTTGAFSDDSPGAYNASCGTDCPKAGARGKVREAAVFDGQDDRLSIPYSADFNLNTLTYGLWVKPLANSGSGKSRLLIARGSPAANINTHSWVELNNDNTISFVVRGGDADACSTTSEVTSSQSLFTNQWNHVMVTYDGAVQKVYINGFKSGETAYAPARGGLCPLGNRSIEIGHSFSLSGYRNFDGLLDELTIYATALTAANVQAIYQYQSAWYDLTQSFPLVIDVDNPQVSLDVYTDLANETTLLGITAVDATSNIENVTVTIQTPSGSSSNVSATQFEGSGPWMFDFTPEGEGDYTFTSVATDAVGRTSTDTKVVYVDDTVPSATVDNSLTSGVLTSNPAGDSGPNALTLFGSVSDNRLITDTVSIDVRDWKDSSVQRLTKATSDGSTWTVEYPFVTPNYGTFNVWADLTDAVGNVFTGTIGAIAVDDVGPEMGLTVGSNLITGTDTIAGTVSDIPYPLLNKVAHFHFEEESGATEFVDSTVSQLTATCDTSCPTAGQSGQYGSAAQFDGSNNLTIAADEHLELTDGTLMAWVKPSTSGSNQTLLAVDDGSTTGFRWQFSGDLQSMLLDNGSETLSTAVSNGAGSVSVESGGWSHVALVMEDGVWTGYVDGRSIGSVTQSFGPQTDLPLHIGSVAGNSGFFFGGLDEVAIYRRALSADEIYDIANPLATTVSKLELRTRHLNGAVWPNVDPEGLKLYLPLDDEVGTTEFGHHSLISDAVTCDDASELCPTAGVDGVFETAIFFDGEDKVVVPDESAFDFDAEVTVSVWIKTDAFEKAAANIVSKGQDTWRISRNANTNVLAFGTQNVNGTGDVLIGTTNVADGQWHHVVGVYDGVSKILYVDGQIDNQTTVDGNLNTNDLPVYIGANSDPVLDIDPSPAKNTSGNRRFNGSIDEVAIFGRALSEDEVLALYQENPWQMVTVDSPDALYSTWQTNLSSNMEGLYDISLRATDSQGNVSTVGQAWTGTIDLMGPRVALTYSTIISGYVQASCAAEDLYIVESGWVCPAGGLTYVDEDADWFVDYFSPLTRTGSLTSAVETIATSGDGTMTACDLFEHCTTITVSPTLATEASIILTPTTGTTLTNYDPITISGTAYSDKFIERVKLYVNGEQLYNKEVELEEGFVNSTSWSTIWTPPAGSPTFSLVAKAETDNQATVFESEPTILTAPILSIEKTVAPSYLISQGDAVTYTIVVANNTTATDLTNVVITDTLPNGVSGNDLSATVDLAVGEAVTYTIPATVTASLFEEVTNTAYLSHGPTSLEDSASFFSCAATIEVQNANGTDEGSLAQAISDVCAGGTITFAGDFSIDLNFRGITIDKDVTIDGSGHDVFINGAETVTSVFLSGGEILIKNLTMVAAGGGEATNFINIKGAAAVTMERVTLVGPSDFPDILQNAGELTLIDSTVISYYGLGGGSLLENLGGTLTIQNSTITMYDFTEPGITRPIFGDADSVVTVNQSTIVGLGPIFSFDGQVTMSNTIYLGTNSDCTGGGAFVDGGYNLFTTGSACSIDSGTSQSVDPALLFTDVVAALADNGGNTQTHALLAGSPALDAIPDGVNGCGTTVITDQRGITRPQDDACDIGAVEGYVVIANDVDLVIGKAVTPAIAEPGQPVTYTLTFSNAGSTTATGVVISDVVPDEVTSFTVQETSDAGVTLTRTTGITYAWTVSDLAAGQGGTITLSGILSEPLAAGSFTNTATITGTTSDSDPGNNSAAAGILVSNVAPVLEAIAPQAITETETLTFTAVATDANGDTLTFSLSDGSTGATISPTTGLFAWATDESDGPGVYSATVVVSDGTLTDSQTVDITVNEINEAPVLVFIPDQTVTEGETVSFTATATDSDVPTQTLTFSLNDGPIGATIDSNSGAFSWPTDESDGPGVYSATVVVSDGTLTDSQTVDITVNEINAAPVLATIDDQIVSEGETVSFTVTASDSDLPAQTLTFSLSDAPSGAVIGNSSGAFSWLTNESDGPGVYSAAIIVSDGTLTDSQTIAITVNEVDTAPVLAAIAFQTVNETEPLTFTASASDAEGNSLTFGLFNPSGGMTIDSDSGEFNWTPTEAQGPGTYFVGILVTDTTALTDTTVAMITVNELNEAPLLTAIGDQTIAESELFTLSLTATDPDLPANMLSYNMSGAPTGATLDENSGLFSWTPSENQGPGEYTLTFSVSDDGTPVLSDSETIALTVNEVNEAPILAAIGDQSVNEGDTLSFIASATDSDVPTQTLTFSLSDAPSGASIDSSTGQVSWATDGSDGPGLYPLTVIVSDGILTDDETIEVTVNNLAPQVSADILTQEVQYSDAISTVTITAADVAGDELQLAATSWSVDGGGFTSGPSGDLIVTAEGCAVASGSNTCTWVLSGTVSVPAGEYIVRATIADEDGGQTEFDLSITVLPEETMVRFKGSNSVGVLVETPGGDSSQFALSVDLSEYLPDQPFDRAGPGDISLAEVSMRLEPVGPGSSVEGVCTPDTVTGTDYDAKLPVSCSFDAVPVNTYLVEVSVGGGYYAGSGEDVLAVYDPSLGYATGSGWFYWPGTETPENGYLGDRANFSFTMTYNKKGKKVKGSLLIIRHLADGSIYRIKSNALENLALGEDGQPSFGWATISGKSTYLEPGWDEAEGNHDFLVYVEDGNEPGSGPDRFWLEMKNKDDVVIPAMSMDRNATANAVEIEDGNIIVPHGLGVSSSAQVNLEDKGSHTIFLPLIFKAGPSTSAQGDNPNSASVTIKQDATAPTASASVSPAANANGWNNGDVTISFSGSDDTSGIASCDADVILSSEGSGQLASGTCTDSAGNISTLATASGINIDKTAPVVSVTGVADGATYLLGSVPTAGCETSDALSGVATEASLSLSGSNGDGSGSITATCDGALDNAGNSGSASVAYTVLTPQEAIGNLQSDIQTLVDDGVLKNNQANGLTKPLDNAIRSLDKGKTADACNQLQDFISEVNAKTPDPLDAATAADLIADVEAIQAAIGCQ